MIIDNLWRKLNYLVPNPLCATKGDKIIKWTDTRSQPTQAELNAVVEMDMLKAEEETGAQDAINASKMNKLLFEINFDQENRFRALEGKQSISKNSYKADLINLYKTL